jgi:hypothetical protein
MEAETGTHPARADQCFCTFIVFFDSGPSYSQHDPHGNIGPEWTI